MGRGGYRPGAGRPKGSKNKPKRAKSVLSVEAEGTMAEQVALLTGAGMSPGDIAAALNVPEVELRARYSRELEHGEAIARAAQLTALSAAAAKGSPTAAKALLALIGGIVPAEEPARDDLSDRALRLLQGGKK